MIWPCQYGSAIKRPTSLPSPTATREKKAGLNHLQLLTRLWVQDEGGEKGQKVSLTVSFQTTDLFALLRVSHHSFAIEGKRAYIHISKQAKSKQL